MLLQCYPSIEADGVHPVKRSYIKSWEVTNTSTRKGAAFMRPLSAASVDEPETATLIQEHVGKNVTILCSISEEVLKKIGIIDKRGAPWYDRIMFRAPKRPIAMPATLIFNKDGRVIFASRSPRVDEGPRVDDILVSLSLLP